MNDKYFEQLCEYFANFPTVESIVLGGSRAGENHDDTSDYDLYIYCSEIPSENERRSVLQEYCQYMEISNSFWELEDDCTLKNGIDIDIVYRNIDDFSKTLSYVIEECNAYNGYTTCMWYNLLNSKIIFDRNNLYTALKRRFSVPYPEKLRKNIIEKNRKLLKDYLPSYAGQIKKAAARNDYVSINHRVAAFMEAYFDIIFAINHLPHPGEKRMVTYAVKNAAILPEAFEKKIDAIFANMFSNHDNLNQCIAETVAALDKIIIIDGSEEK